MAGPGRLQAPVRRAQRLRALLEEARAVAALLGDKGSLAAQCVEMYAQALRAVVVDVVIETSKEQRAQGGQAQAQTSADAGDDALRPSKGGEAGERRAGAGGGEEEEGVRRTGAAGGGDRAERARKREREREMREREKQRVKTDDAATTQEEGQDGAGGDGDSKAEAEAEAARKGPPGVLLDIFGRAWGKTGAKACKDLCLCPQCGKKCGVSFFAQHLEKCMMLTQRSRASAGSKRRASM